MIRWSINDNKERFKLALIETHQLYSQGVTSDEIVFKLSSNYQENEIKKLLRWIQDSSKVYSLSKEKMILKISLWILLVCKLFFLTTLSHTAYINITWGIALFILAPILNIIGLVLLYRLIPSSYVVIFLLFISGISNVGENLTSLFSIDFGTLLWTVIFIYTITYFVGGYYSFKLYRTLPEGLIKTNRMMEQLNLKTAAVA